MQFTGCSENGILHENMITVTEGRIITRTLSVKLIYTTYNCQD